MAEIVSSEDRSNVASGHKANLSNPNTSEESKQHSKQELEKLGGDDAFYGDEDQNKSKNPNQVAGGLKAALNNPNTTEEGRQEAQRKLDEMK